MPDLTVQEMRLLKERVFKAAEAGDVSAILDSLKDADEQVCKEVLCHRSEKDGGSLTPLMIAAIEGHREVVQLLLEGYGVEVDQTGTLVPRSSEEVTALWCVSHDGLFHRDVFELLLDRCANINHMDAHGFETPLLLVCRRGKVRLTDFLVSHGADVNLPNRFGQTPLIQACKIGNVKMVEKLMNHGADVNLSNGHGETPLIKACRNGNRKMVEKLLNHGADVNLPSIWGLTPLMESIRSSFPGCDKIIELLLQQGADPNRQDLGKSTALHYAVLHKRLDVMILLLDNGAILRKNSQCLTPPLCGLLENEDSSDMIHRFLLHPRIPRQDKVDALEIAGALRCLEDLDLGYPYLVEAMEERFSDPGDVLSKPLCPPVAALGNVVESQTLEELNARRGDDYTLLMECLLILERVLGEVDGPYLGRCYSLVGKSLPGVWTLGTRLSLWHYLMQKHPRHVSSLLEGAINSIAWMLEIGKTPNFCEIKPLMDCAIAVWENKSHHSEKEEHLQWKSLVEQLYAGLRICKAITHLSKRTAEEKEVAGLVQQVVNVLDGETSIFSYFLMKLAVKGLVHSLYKDEQSEISLDVSLMHLLVESGACENAVDEEGNSPLAVITSFPLSRKPHHSETVKNVVEMLIKAEAHLDSLNAYGQMPLDTGDADMSAILREFCPLSLKCLASRVIVKCSLPYQSCLPEVVQKFVQLHERKSTRHK